MSETRGVTKLPTEIQLGGDRVPATDSAMEDYISAHDGRSAVESVPHDRRSSHQWVERRRSSPISQRRPSLVLQRRQTGRRWWMFTLRDWDDQEDEDWWFASTAIPLLAATLGPLANVTSIAALVTYWRMCLVEDVSAKDAQQCLYTDGSQLGQDLTGRPFKDPTWCYWLNVASLIAGFGGNGFLLCNFTKRIRYIIALPATIVLWYIATGILIAITIGMEVYVPPARPQQIYTQGFWYAVISACMYMICSMLLMINMLGYFLGHYPQHFTLTESQRTLILQTMLFFFWLAGGGILFSRVETLYGQGTQPWNYVNALYFSDVTILTVGFGDLYPTSDIGRGLVFPYSVGGIIMLGLMVSSITSFAAELGSEKVVRRHVERSRARTVGRTVTTSMELAQRRTSRQAEPFNPVGESRPYATVSIADREQQSEHEQRTRTGLDTLRHVASFAAKPPQRRTRQPKLLLLREEKDRFDAMRKIQRSTAKFKRWYALFASVTAFGLLWCVGAVVFWRCERYTQDMTYFKALYFCYVSLLTIGYGDLAPISNSGRPFFVFWSLIAVPTMTILVSDLGDTVINKFKHGTFRLADFTVLPKTGVWREFIETRPWLLAWLQGRKERRAARKRLGEGFPAGPEPEPELPTPTIDELAMDEPSNAQLARRLPSALRRVADDMRTDPKKGYTYEEWVDFTRLIRFSAVKEEGRETENPEGGLIEWDWIGEDSPMVSKGSEADFVLDRLCESMHRYLKSVTLPPLPADNASRAESSGRHEPKARATALT